MEVEHDRDVSNLPDMRQGAHTMTTTPAAPSGEDTSGNRLDAALREAMQIMAAYNPGLNPNACESAMRGLLLRVATPAPESPNVARQWLWRIFNLGFPLGHESGTNEWGDWNLISDEDAQRLARDEDTKAYEFVLYAPSNPAASQVAAQATEQREPADRTAKEPK